MAYYVALNYVLCVLPVKVAKCLSFSSKKLIHDSQFPNLLFFYHMSKHGNNFQLSMLDVFSYNLGKKIKVNVCSVQ